MDLHNAKQTILQLREKRLSIIHEIRIPKVDIDPDCRGQVIVEMDISRRYDQHFSGGQVAEVSIDKETAVSLSDIETFIIMMKMVLYHVIVRCPGLAVYVDSINT